MNKPNIEIKRYRERAGVTLAELASILEIDVYTLISMEKGEIEPSIVELQKISHICHTSIDELMGLQPERNHPELF